MKDNPHYRRIKYPTGFIWKWCSLRYLVERRGHKVREISYDQLGNALFEFEDGVQVMCSQNSVRWLDKETREQVLGKRHKTWSEIRKKPFVSKFKREKKAAVRERLIAAAEEAGVKVQTKQQILSIGKVPAEIKESIRYASGLRGLSMAEWVMQAIMDKLDKELVQPFNEANMVQKTHKVK